MQVFAKQFSRRTKLDGAKMLGVGLENAKGQLHGSEMVAQFDDQPALYFEDEGLNVEKPRLVLINYGQHAWFDDVKVWKAEPDAAWPARRERLQAAGKK